MVALVAGVLGFAVLLHFAIRRAHIQRRPVLLVGMIAGALPSLYVGLTWATLISDSYLRLARPWVTLLSLAATSFIALRLVEMRREVGRWRARIGDLLTMTAAITAA